MFCRWTRGPQDDDSTTAARDRHLCNLRWPHRSGCITAHPRWLGNRVRQRVKHLHLLFQSYGGVVGDGVCLYSVFRELPFDLTVYNSGAVQSIGTVAYLGAKKRKVSTHATLVIHRSTGASQPATAARLKAATESLVLDDERTEAILRQHTNLSPDQWKQVGHDLWLSASQAVAVGLAHEIGEFAPPFWDTSLQPLKGLTVIRRGLRH